MSWWRNQGVTLKVGCPATEIDVGRREIKIANDESVSFSRLVPAAGSAPLRLNVPAADLRANCSIPPISSQAQGAASLECPPTFSAPHRRGDRIGWLIPVMALKRPAVAPAEGLLTEAVLKHARVAPASSPTALASVSVCTALPNGASGRLAARRWQDGSIGEVWNGLRDRLRNHSISVLFSVTGDGHRSFSASSRHSSGTERVIPSITDAYPIASHPKRSRILSVSTG